MPENNFVISKLNISEVINEAAKLYKDNYKLFIKISLFTFLINFLSNTLDVFQYLFKNNTAVIFYKLFLFVMMFPFLYFSIKFSIAMYACVSERYRKKDIDIKGALNIASEKFWRYVGVSIQFILILLVPIAGVVGPFFFIKDLLIKWSIIGLFAIPSVYFGAIYGFAPLIVIFEKEKKQYFSVSKKLVEGDFWKVVFLTFVVMVAFSIPYYLYMYVFNDYKTILGVNKYIISSLNQLFYVFVTPFTNSIYVALYYTLKDSKRIG